MPKNRVLFFGKGAACLQSSTSHPTIAHRRAMQPRACHGPCLVQLSQQPWHWRRLIATFGSMMAQVAQRWVI